MKPRRKQRRSRSQQGFTLLEVMISIVVLTAGLVGLLTVFSLSLVAAQASQNDMIAKLLASEAMENVFTARDTDQVDPVLGRPIQWSDIQNVSAGGIFVDGPTAILGPGGDGIIGTADDSGAVTLDLANANGTLPATTASLSAYTRTIQISNLTGESAVRSITVTITYPNPRSPTPKTYVLNGYISQYR